MARNLAYLRITTCLMLVLKLRGPPVTRYSDVFVFCLADTIDDEENDDITRDDDEMTTATVTTTMIGMR